MVDIIHDPGQDRLIDELYAYVAIDPATGLEGICGLSLDGLPMQAVSSSRTTIEKMEPFIREMARTYISKKFKLIRFGKPQIIKTYD